MVEQNSSSLDNVFHALADPTRRTMLTHLATGQRNLTELAAPFKMSFAAASKHVRVLEASGLVHRQIEGRTHRFRLEAGPLERADRWLRFYEHLWTVQLDALEDMLELENATQATPPRKTGTRQKKKVL